SHMLMCVRVLLYRPLPSGSAKLILTGVTATIARVTRDARYFFAQRDKLAWRSKAINNATHANVCTRLIVPPPTVRISEANPDGVTATIARVTRDARYC